MPAGGVLGRKTAIDESTWGDTGLDRVGSPNAGQNIAGLCFAVTDLKGDSGIPLTNTSVTEGVKVTGGTPDPRCFCAVESTDNQPMRIDAGPDQAAFLKSDLSDTDLAGPEVEPDCRVDMYDLAAVAMGWSTQHPQALS